MARTQLNNLANEITNALQQYTDDVEKGIKEVGDKVAKEAVKTLKKRSPKLTRSYSKGWRVRTKDNKKIIYNKTDYQLTHLLENGHAKSGGGRVPAKVHIRPVEEQAIEDYEEGIRRVIQG